MGDNRGFVMYKPPSPGSGAVCRQRPPLALLVITRRAALRRSSRCARSLWSVSELVSGGWRCWWLVTCASGVRVNQTCCLPCPFTKQIAWLIYYLYLKKYFGLVILCVKHKKLKIIEKKKKESYQPTTKILILSTLMCVVCA